MADWFQALEQELQRVDGDSLAAYENYFRRLDDWRNRVPARERRVLEMLWWAAVAYLVLDVVLGDVLHRQAVELHQEAQGAAWRGEGQAA